VSIQLAAALTGCTVATPFRGPLFSPRAGVTVGVNTVQLVVTHAVLGDDRDLRSAFWTHVWKIADELPAQPGFVGHSMRRNLVGTQAWTMTVWLDERSLGAFAASDVHRTAIAETGAALLRFRSARIELPVDEVPIAWSRARELLDLQSGMVE
jgi:heme-degrading monooxygenase HmoA